MEDTYQLGELGQLRAAIYARVSSERQEREETIQSQLAELRARLAEEGYTAAAEYADEGYGRDKLSRPGLDRLRDAVQQGDCDRLYVQAPDRLASGGKLMLLVEEFQQAGVAVVFLRGSVEDTPEGKLLLHMQGAIAEYERAKIAERTRRGKLYWARQGAMVGGHAPYGYRLQRRSETQRARLEREEVEAATVQAMFRWVVEEQLSTRAVARRLTQQGVTTSRGAAQWQPTAVHRILTNLTYAGTFYYLRTLAVEPARRLAASPYRKRQNTGKRPRPQSEWIGIPVPAIVPQELWNAAQQQLALNAARSPRHNTQHEYLLSSLVRCSRCGGAYYGFVQHGCRGYRCLRAHHANSSTGQRCPSGSLPAAALEEAVWESVTEALQNPEVLLAEYQQRVAAATAMSTTSLESRNLQLRLAAKRLREVENRLTDAYLNEAMELDRYKEEMAKLRQRRRTLDRQAAELEREAALARDTDAALAGLQQFCGKVAVGLAQLTFEEKRRLLRLVVERVVADGGVVRIDTVIPLQNDQLRAPLGELVEP